MNVNEPLRKCKKRTKVVKQPRIFLSIRSRKIESCFLGKCKYGAYLQVGRQLHRKRSLYFLKKSRYQETRISQSQLTSFGSNKKNQSFYEGRVLFRKEQLDHKPKNPRVRKRLFFLLIGSIHLYFL